LKAEFGCSESVLLRHRVLGAMETVENERSEIWKPNFSVAADVLLALIVHKVKLVALGVPGHVEVLA
jgi:hypothetical protein